MGYNALHQWIRKYLPPQKLCQICFLVSPQEVACITAPIYNRDFKNWLRLCRKCHKKYDDIIPRLIKNRRKKRKKSK